MRGPAYAEHESGQEAPSWRIYEATTVATNTLAPMIDPSADTAPDTVNDVSPHYLPDGSIVWSTTRQRNSQAVLINEGKPEFIANDEARTEPIFDLEVTAAQTAAPPIRSSSIRAMIGIPRCWRTDASSSRAGTIPRAWTRWTSTPINPDGTDLELYYGAQSHMTGTDGSVIEFSHPREMQSGNILVIARQYTDVDFGGQLEIIAGNQYVENTQPLLAYASLTGPAQTAATTNQVSTLPGPPRAADSTPRGPSGTARDASWSAGPSAGCSTMRRIRRASCPAPRTQDCRRSPTRRRDPPAPTACGRSVRRRTPSPRSFSRPRE